MIDMQIHIHHHYHPYQDCEEGQSEQKAFQEKVLNLLSIIINKENQMAKTMAQALADLQQKVTDSITVEESAITLLGGLSQAIKDANGDPAALDAIATSLDTEKQKLADAIVANTPAAPQA